jgi:hypothetical protein
LTMGVNPQGFFLSLSFPFFPGHPPLFIPWNEITVRRTCVLWAKCVELHLGREPAVPLRISERVARRLAPLAGEAWPQALKILTNGTLVSRRRRDWGFGIGTGRCEWITFSPDGDGAFSQAWKIYRSDEGEEEGPHGWSPPHRCDESSTGYSSAGCSPAEPASASPAGENVDLGRGRLSIES